MTELAADDEEMLSRAAAGDELAVSVLLDKYRSKLKRMVACRLDDRLSMRIDASDVVQEAMIVAAGGFAEYCHERPMPFYFWLRRITCQRLTDLHRRHLRAERRSVLREQIPFTLSSSTVEQLAVQLAVVDKSPGSAAQHAEMQSLARIALERLDEPQRELLLLHYIEGLSLAEAAEALQITAEAARMRHFRALKRLRAVLDGNSESQNP
jgi:RNA polymerase sigma-70 factor (ECF subfamily)